ncbi:MAG: hypothetical protein IJ939_02430, partial [Clostridia bacterium]|nr:hypothetical protein [Clostridia bacterium]
MLKFFHGYHPDVWDALIKTGMMTSYDGVRIPHDITIREYKQFNNVAKIGGHLHRFMVENKCPFYIDRLQGGTFIDHYPYDTQLLGEYIDLVGDENYYGMQMHEWVSNYWSDLGKIGDLSDEGWTAENIAKRVNEKYKMPHLFLETMDEHEMQHFGRPKNSFEIYNVLEKLYAKRVSQHHRILPVDSLGLAYSLEIDHGAKRFMAEIGAQTPHTRLQVAYGRAMAKAHGCEFGTYYETWGGEPFTTCNYQKYGKNEWDTEKPEDFPYQSAGPNGGSSRSLQKRLYVYSYMNNVDFMSEEWSVANIFNDWDEFELSPYGEINVWFAHFRKKYTDVGEKITPIAAVLNSSHKILDRLASTNGFGERAIGGEKEEKMVQIKTALKEIFANAKPMLGNAIWKALDNSDIPDAVDLLNFTSNGALDNYKYLVDVTATSELSDSAWGKKVCPISDIETILRKELPCYVDGGLLWMVNERV